MTTPDNNEPVHAPLEHAPPHLDRSALATDIDYLVGDESDKTATYYIITVGLILFASCGSIL